MKAKYCPRGGFWAVHRTSDASALWKNIQRLKPDLKNQVQWQIGDGTRILTLNQPWFGMWETKQILTNRQRDMTVADLYDQHQNSWKVQEIELIFGSEATHCVTQEVTRPRNNPLIKDNLIWRLSVKGKYNTKEGYAHLAKNIPKI